MRFDRDVFPPSAPHRTEMLMQADFAGSLSTRSTLARIGPYEVTDDPRRVDVPAVHAFLAHDSYWRKGVTLERVARSVRMSLPISVHLTTATPRMVGFARVVTDTVTHAWIDDLFVLREHRRRGIAGAMISAALAHPAVADASLQLLLTADAHALYARHGFRQFPDAVALMARTTESAGGGPPPPVAPLPSD